MVSWDSPDSDPIKDIGDYAERIASMARNTGVQLTAIIVSPELKERYRQFLLEQRRYQSELDATPRWRRIKRYKLQRKLGWSRLRIVWPWVYFQLRRIHMRIYDFRHRNDPDWY